ncbi:GGDEF domain-containing protein [Paracoccus sp. WLY502]|uniref:GGDEF domain-containing protein n=1 Tax=Paracoccus yibinensis TaxID=3068891 RepID=UPI0027966C37|nr:GGDEF domain-containing protein [Paracoccus sp. WLY502]MDQ1899978.1 GGDEF domain-containing protein [Paracoccus sp. WLY502]
MTHALTLGQAALDRMMPMHLCIADCGLIHFAGPTMRKLMPPGAQGVEDIFVEARGIATGHVIAAIRAAEPGDRLALRLRHHRQLMLRGHVVAPGFGGLLLNFGFGVSLSDAVATFGLTEGDFAPTELALELMFLQEANRAIQQELARFNRHLMLARQDAEREAHTDALTGLLNRRGLQAVMRNALDPKGDMQGFALVHLDLDNFKQVNDRLGHGAGDRLLENVARVLGRAVRSRDHVARIGGDEFVLILGGSWTCQALTAIGMRIVQGIEAISPEDCAVSASLGIVLSAGYGPDSIDQMLNDADVALYRSKRAGKGRVSVAPLPVDAAVKPLPGPR